MNNNNKSYTDNAVVVCQVLTLFWATLYSAANDTRIGNDPQIGPQMVLGPFLESPGNLTGPKSYFDIQVSRKVDCVLTSNEVHFVSLADNFTV